MTAPVIRLTNTATRTKEDFAPIDPGNVRMYVCGPTVYDRAHLGNARPVVVFDVLFRLLRHVYGAGAVTYVRNFTDVDDKINAKAAETGRPIRDITDETIGWYHADMDALGALRPSQEPRATDWIGAMVAMIERLVALGHAYAVEGHVLFRVRSYSAYGRLSGRSVDDMIAGARVEVAPFKEDPMDFVLWKPSGPDLPGWDSPWGRGRPGWHIECSAMARELLGDTFDIHGGGIDLTFPHHENEIAQSACAHPEGRFARYWLHNEMLLVEGEKMSKSLGNFFTVRQLLDKAIPGEVIRYVLLSSHYRSTMDWTENRVFEAREFFNDVVRAIGNDEAEGTSSWTRARRDMRSEAELEVVAALKDDLNTPEVFSILHSLRKSAHSNRNDLLSLLGSLEFLGLEVSQLKHVTAMRRGLSQFLNAWQSIEELGGEPSRLLDADRAGSIRKYTILAASARQRLGSERVGEWLDRVVASQLRELLSYGNWRRAARNSPLSTEMIVLLKELRAFARRERDFQQADEIRRFLQDNGVQLLDERGSTTWRRQSK